MKTWEDIYLLISDAISGIYEKRESNNIAKIILEDCFQREIDSVVILSQNEFEKVQNIIQRLLIHEPVQFITNKAYFWDCVFYVDSRVLIPRAETEELVYQICQDFKYKSNLSIMDIGTGSGCIPITLSLKLDCKSIEGIDISEEALIVANKNNILLNAAVQFKKLDVLTEELDSNKKYDIIVSNPPYIPIDEIVLMPKHVVDFEPSIALFTSEDALIFYKKIIKIAAIQLFQKGKLYFECNEFNAEKVMKLFENEPFEDVILEKDMSGKNRMIIATHI